MSMFQCSLEAQDKVSAFEQADAAFKAAWEQFEHQHAAELEYLDKLREDRNSKLDEARRILRAEAQEADITRVRFVKQGPFNVQKKWSDFYSPEKFIMRLRELGLYDTALSTKIIQETYNFAKFDVIKNFLKMEGKEKEFEDCEDGIELTPAVSGPKPISPFGAEVKDK